MPTFLVKLICALIALSIFIIFCGACIHEEFQRYDDEEEEIIISKSTCRKCYGNKHENDILSNIEKNEYETLEDKDCIICANMMKMEDIERLRCQHMFHRKCLSAWMKIKSNCPVCRRSGCCVKIKNNNNYNTIGGETGENPWHWSSTNYNLSIGTWGLRL